MSIGALSAALNRMFPASSPAINNNNDLQNYVKNNSGPDNYFLKNFDVAGGNKNPDGIIIADDLTSYLSQHKKPTTAIEAIQNNFAQTLLDKMTQFGDKALHFDPNNSNSQVSFTA